MGERRRENEDTKDLEEGGLLDQRTERNFVIEASPGAWELCPVNLHFHYIHFYSHNHKWTS